MISGRKVPRGEIPFTSIVQLSIEITSPHKGVDAASGCPMAAEGDELPFHGIIRFNGIYEGLKFDPEVEGLQMGPVHLDLPADLLTCVPNRDIGDDLCGRGGPEISSIRSV